MTEIILSVVIALLLIERYFSQKAIQQERNEWTKAMIAKSLREVTDNEVLDKTPPPTDEPKIDYIPLNVEDEEMFDKHIQRELDDAKAEYEKDS